MALIKQMITGANGTPGKQTSKPGAPFARSCIRKSKAPSHTNISVRQRLFMVKIKALRCWADYREWEYRSMLPARMKRFERRQKCKHTNKWKIWNVLWMRVLVFPPPSPAPCPPAPCTLATPVRPFDYQMWQKWPVGSECLYTSDTNNVEAAPLIILLHTTNKTTYRFNERLDVPIGCEVYPSYARVRFL